MKMVVIEEKDLDVHFDFLFSIQNVKRETLSDNPCEQCADGVLSGFKIFSFSYG